MLSYTERKFVRELELAHGVIISASAENGIVAKHWKTDVILAEADSVYELGVVLRSMHIYPDDDFQEGLPE